MGCVMSRKLPVFFVACIAVFATFVALGPSRRSNSPRSSPTSSKQATNLAAAQARLLSSYGKLPLTFEQNLGQTDSRVRFLAHGNGYALFLTGQEAVLRLDAPIARDKRVATAPATGPAKASQPAQKPSSVVRLALAGSNQHSLVEGLDLQPGRSNYFIGNDPAKWQRGVPNYARVKYSSVYPGIDLIYYGNQGHLESDFAIAPGTDPSQIALRIEGADNLKIDSEAGLLLATKSGDVVLHRPVAYQEAAGLRQEIAANYIERGPGVVGIQLGPYDSTRPLVIDPVLVYSTYLGGNQNDRGLAIAADSSGNAYITGMTDSTNFPTAPTVGPPPFQSAFIAPADAFVTKMDPTGTALVFSTYLGGGGSNGTSGEGIAIDSATPPNVYVAGTTDSTSFPTSATPFQSNKKGTSSNAFMTKLDPTGSTLPYSTYIGGTGTDACHAIAVDVNGNAYITGDTTSTDYPITPVTMQSSNSSGTTAFVTRFDPAMSGANSFVYSTYLGGSTSGHKDTGAGIAVDASGHAFVTGLTNSPTFPVTPSAFQGSIKGTAGNSFLAKIDTTMATVLPVYSSYLGGTATAEGESALGIALDPRFNGNVYIAGSAATSDFPTTAGAFQKTLTTNLPAYVARFDTTQSGVNSLVYSTYLEGSGTQFARSIAVDPAGNAFVTGETSSNDFPVTPGASQPANGGGLSDAFLTELNPGGSALLFSTYLGGVGTDVAFGMAIDSASPPSVYLTGLTTSTAFPVTPGAFQTTNSSLGGTAFVSKFTPASAAAVFASPSTINFGTVNLNTPSPSQAVTLVNNTTSAVTGITITFAGPNPADFSQTNTCGSSLAANSTCTINVVYTPAISGAESATLNIADSASSSPQTVALSGTGSASAQPDFSLSVSPSPLSVTAGGPGNFTVTVNSLNNFSSPVALSCSGAPQNSACALLPASVTPTIGGNQTSAGSITTHAHIPPSLPAFPRLRPLGILGVLALLLALLMARAAARRGARKLAWGFALLGVLALAGCSGVPGGGGGGGNGSTPKGTTTITITGTSGALNHTTTFSFTVN